MLGVVIYIIVKLNGRIGPIRKKEFDESKIKDVVRVELLCNKAGCGLDFALDRRTPDSSAHSGSLWTVLRSKSTDSGPQCSPHDRLLLLQTATASLMRTNLNYSSSDAIPLRIEPQLCL
ncbi:hypothetical protein L2E82_11858 [Cichorium intybus]|uniref:Uncharacterized protein n=1 Tax=Cichorium intybus TaxID=13427 RepID=A0ACB9GEN5_CICIN|nr:hypothetical protein L2E82_11858 [Cichorium intybus]